MSARIPVLSYLLFHPRLIAAICMVVIVVGVGIYIKNKRQTALDFQKMGSPYV